jgi:Integrase zinc binding domain
MPMETAHVEELLADDDPVLFARSRDPFHPRFAELIATYIKLHHLGIQEARRAAGDTELPKAALRQAGERHAHAALQKLPSGVVRRLRRQARLLRVHPTQPTWYVTEETLRTGQRLWLAIPPVEYRWGLTAAYHDRMGHAGINQTLHAMRQNFSWPGIKADVAAYVKQCHGCQVKNLEMETVIATRPPRMSGPMEHVHIDLAGPFEQRAAKQQQATNSRRSNKRSSTEKTGTVYV